MPVLSITSVSKHFGADVILDDVSFGIDGGEHVALVGANGAGKSTLLRIVAGQEQPDSGLVSRTRDLRVAYLPQEPEFDPSHTLYEALLDTFADTIRAQERLRSIERELANSDSDSDLVEEYGRLQSLVEHVGYNYHQQIERVLTGLGLVQSSWYTSVSRLSGGQRTRANLARTLLREADLLLLDEPTNHLDIPAVEWLETYLRDLKQAFIIVAHDRYLLDRVTKRTLDLSLRKVTDYGAAYSRFLDLKKERTERQRIEYDAQQQNIAKTEDFIRRYGAGQRYKEARGRQKRLDRLERIDRPTETNSIHLAMSRPRRSGEIVLEERALEVGFEGRPLVRLPEQITVRRGEKIAVIGPNGSGKTTLLRTLIGKQSPLGGEIRWGAKTSIGYYSQTLEQLDEASTALGEIQKARAMGEEDARGFLGRFLFTGDDVFKSVRVLSGGEKSRVALAKLILEEPNVLVLDEPTNHLDISSRDALQGVLEEFTGTLIFVSHDRFLIDALTDQLWVVENEQLVRYDGSYSDYRSGKTKPLDRLTRGGPVKGDGHQSPADRVRTLQEEAEALAGRLAELGPSAQLGQLSELSDRYGNILSELGEAQDAWVDSVRAHLRAYSGSPAQSGAAKQQ
ncbi:MAG: ABC-F family ATP-binding cassette domain-containing protein [Chloroflexota bacterium]